MRDPTGSSILKTFRVRCVKNSNNSHKSTEQEHFTSLCETDKFWVHPECKLIKRLQNRLERNETEEEEEEERKQTEYKTNEEEIWKQENAQGG